MSLHSITYQHLRLENTPVLPLLRDPLSAIPLLLLCRVSSLFTSQLSIKIVKSFPLNVEGCRDDKCQRVEKQVQYLCSKTGDEGSIYAARQGMRAVSMQQGRG